MKDDGRSYFRGGHTDKEGLVRFIRDVKKNTKLSDEDAAILAASKWVSLSFGFTFATWGCKSFRIQVHNKTFLILSTCLLTEKSGQAAAHEIKLAEGGFFLLFSMCSVGFGISSAESVPKKCPRNVT